MAQLSDRIGQFITVPYTFINAPDVSTPARWLFVVLRMYTNGTSGIAFPSIDTLSDRTGMKRHTVIRAIQELIDAGWLTRIKRYGRTPLYVLQMPNPSSSAVSGTSAQSGTISSAQSGTISSAQSGTLSRVSDLDRDNQIEVGAPAAAPIAVPDSMRSQKAPPRAKAGHLAWPKVAAFMRGMNLTHVSAERAAAIEETCFAVSAEDVEKRAGEWLARYGKPVKDETWGRAFDVCANGWAERKAIPAPAVFQPPPTRKGAKPQVSYTDEQRKAADERAAAQIAEREAQRAKENAS